MGSNWILKIMALNIGSDVDVWLKQSVVHKHLYSDEKMGSVWVVLVVVGGGRGTDAPINCGIEFSIK